MIYEYLDGPRDGHVELADEAPLGYTVTFWLESLLPQTVEDLMLPDGEEVGAVYMHAEKGRMFFQGYITR